MRKEFETIIQSSLEPYENILIALSLKLHFILSVPNQSWFFCILKQKNM